MTRTSAWMGLPPPTLSNIRSCNTRSNLTCIGIGMSPISSRNRVPPWASSKRPRRAAMAPVKAPFSWPNSSLSSSSAGMAPQLMGTKGPALRVDSSWMALATTSLPVPDSPRISTLASVSATWPMRRRTSWIPLPLPTSRRSRAWPLSWVCWRGCRETNAWQKCRWRVRDS